VFDAGEGPPDVLVLGGGGILGEAWLSSVLAGIEQAGGFDGRDCRRLLGTSAGSIVAATLAGGLRPADRLGPLVSAVPAAAGVSAARAALAAPLALAAEFGATAAAPLASFTLSQGALPGAVLRRALLGRVPHGTRSHERLMEMMDELGASFDGQLLVAAVDAGRGRRVLFGGPAAPTASVAEAVAASCAIPGVFAPVRIGDRDYVDGGAWSPTNMDALDVRRGERLLCLNPTASLRPTPGTLAGVFGPLSRTIAASEALALRHRGAAVTTVNPNSASVRAMGVNLMDPGPRARVIAAGYAQGAALVGSSRRAA
jgi:NTE family protein